MGTVRHRAAGSLIAAAGLSALTFASARAAESEGVLEEIVVTATKRVENVQDVPISIGVVAGEKVENMRITDLVDLTSYVPNLTVQSTFGNWAVRVRGLGSGVTNLAFDSSVSIFNDGVYCGRSRCLETAFLDVGRIEVARGPQGALYGKSTIAGALSILSARPTEEFDSYVRGGYEVENDGYYTQAMVSGPLTDSIRARIVGMFEDGDGEVENPVVGVDEPETQRWAARGILEWDLTDAIAASLKAEHFDAEIDGRTNQLVSRGTFGALSTDPLKEFDRNGIRRVSTGTVDEDYDYSESNAYTLSVDTELGEHTLSAIAGYWELEYRNWLDVDGVREGFLNSFLAEDYDQTSGELRLLSPTGNTFEYIAGVLYHTSNTQTRQHSPFHFPPFTASPIPVGSDRNIRRDSDTVSVYGQLTWHVAEGVRIVGDLRYTDEEQDAYGFSLPSTYPDRRHPVYTPTAFLQPPEYHFYQTRTDDSIDPSLRVQWDVGDTAMFYVAYATGSKPGGLKANDSTLGAQLLAKNNDPLYLQKYIGQPSVNAQQIREGIEFQDGNGVFDFEDEEAQNYELGLKTLVADGRATFNVALFTMDFENLQTSSYDGTRFIIRNAASAEITGVEIESVFQANDYLRLSGALGYLDHEFGEYKNAECIVKDASGAFADPTCRDGFEDMSGEKLERTPNWEMTLGADWESPIAGDLLFRANASLYYSGGMEMRQDFHPLGRQDSYKKVDLRLALADDDDTWEIAAIGRNLTDVNVIQHAYEVAATNFVSFSTGRTIALQGTVHF
jgi:iron complex outermembrane receptor protein